MNKPAPAIELKGAKEIIRAMGQIEPALARKIIRRALRLGVKPIQAAEKANAPRKTGVLKKAIKVRAMKRSRNKIGIRVMLGKDDFPGKFYGAPEEYGWKPGKPGSPHRVKRPGVQFAKKAFKEQGPSAKTTILNDLASGFNEVVSELSIKS